MLNVQTVTITPEYAQVLLGHNTANRNVRQPVIDRYARDMAAGNWLLNGSTIVMNCDGTLLDGQHRLLACIKAGAPFTTLLVEGVEQAAMASIDANASRKYSDVLRIRGERHAVGLAALIRLCIVWSGGKTNRSHLAPTNAECDAFLERHPEAREAARIAKRAKSGGARVPESSIGAFALNAIRASGDVEAVEDFCDAIRLGTSDKSSPTYRLWQTFIKWSAQSNVTRQSVVYLAVIVKCWNDCVLGNERKVYAWRRSGSTPEDFPVMLNDDGDPLTLAVAA